MQCEQCNNNMTYLSDDIWICDCGCSYDDDEETWEFTEEIDDDVTKILKNMDR